MRKSWSHNRLAPSAVAFAIEYFKLRRAANLPELNYLARNYDVLAMMNTCFLGVILITGTLKTITAVLLGGSVTDVLRSLPADLTLSWEDHFNVALVKLMAASMQTTAISGLANELPALHAYRTQNAGNDAVAYIGQDGKVVVGGGLLKAGFAREVKKVKAQTTEASDPMFGGWGKASRWRALGDVGKSAMNFVKWTAAVLWFRTLAVAGWGTVRRRPQDEASKQERSELPNGPKPEVCMSTIACRRPFTKAQ